MQDIHALKELLGVLFDIAVPIIQESKKDGFQWTDIFAFMSSEQFKNEFGPMIKDLPLLGAEFSDFTVEEGFELAVYLMGKSKMIMDALK